eukprot:CAMPEP_0198277516 /NCGR_PEP_ID=MMETSP1447-20131203/65889_1 /TAXON_ID=420782 /ORGANISM="Chaetoceros dichaeta, Strain CCMP1751" /LENGTH=480 /DNA_ID=CAMNT_0043972537 /DNA_START=85 /DNA_END=1527 /DNA_ORIENTATION=+
MLRLFLCTLLAITVTADSTTDTTATSLPPVLMHYMPWFEWSRKDGWAGWHWKERLDWKNVLLPDKRIASHYTPAIGPYNSVDKDVIQYHLKLMKAAGVKGIIIDWYGTRENVYDFKKPNLAASDAIIEVASEMGLLFTVCYEDWTLVAKRDVAWGVEPTGEVLQDAKKDLRTDLRYIRDNYANKPGFLREPTSAHTENEHSTQGRPVMLIFGPRNIKDGTEWTSAMSEVFTDVNNRPKLLTITGNAMDGEGTFSWFPPLKQDGFVDGENTSLNTVRDYLTNFYERKKGTLHIGSIFPGFKDYYKEGGSHESYGSLPEFDGKTFNASMYEAQKYHPTFIQAATWNDWEEGTIFEPREGKGKDRYYFLLRLQQYILGYNNSAADFDVIFETYRERKGADFGWPGTPTPVPTLAPTPVPTRTPTPAPITSKPTPRGQILDGLEIWNRGCIINSELMQNMRVRHPQPRFIYSTTMLCIHDDMAK